MALSKTTKERRQKEGKCTMCENPAAMLPAESNKPARLSKYCDTHLKYWGNYRKIWTKENKPKTEPKLRCSVCRQLGHTVRHCKDPRAAAFRESLKIN